MSNITTSLFQEMVQAASTRLGNQAEYVNSLNVFPVPDGDTGTNMGMTIENGAKEVANKPASTVGEVGQILSKGLLMGARGNSGVITSQLFRGFGQSIKDKTELDGQDLAYAFQSGVEVAYKAVMKPVEGTILTVSRGAATAALKKAEETDDAVEVMRAALEGAKGALAKTPEMLPVLKEAGVVDSGGQGLLEVLRGAIDGYHGKEVDYSQFEASAAPKITKISPQAEADIKFGYCTEFIILLEKPLPQEEVSRFREFLDSIGDSIVLVADDEIVKVHVHTNHPGQAFERALTYGQLSRMKIDNMREEHQEKLIKDAEKLAREQAEKEKEPPKDHGFISVSVGEGLSQIFRELGVDYLIEGGQTMNPSTEDMLNAIDKVNAKTIYIFPNNKNIILAANQARDLTEDKEIIVVPTKTIPQGISAMISFVPEKDGEENLASMTDAISRVKTGQVTYAVRDTRIDDKEIHEGDIMGIGDHGILAVGKGRENVAKEMVAAMVDEDSEVISIYYGAETTEEDAESLAAELEEAYPDCEVEVNMGGQPIYYYIISVE